GRRDFARSSEAVRERRAAFAGGSRSWLPVPRRRNPLGPRAVAGTAWPVDDYQSNGPAARTKRRGRGSVPVGGLDAGLAPEIRKYWPLGDRAPCAWAG